MPDSVWSVLEQERLKNFKAGTLILRACREGQRYPPQVIGREQGSNRSYPQKTRVGKPTQKAGSLFVAQVVLTLVLQEQPKRHQVPLYCHLVTPKPASANLDCWCLRKGGGN